MSTMHAIRQLRADNQERSGRAVEAAGAAVVVVAMVVVVVGEEEEEEEEVRGGVLGEGGVVRSLARPDSQHRGSVRGDRRKKLFNMYYTYTFLHVCTKKRDKAERLQASLAPGLHGEPIE